MANQKYTLIVTDDKDGSVSLPIKKGVKFEVVEVSFATPDLKPAPMKALLCGYDPGLCAAVIEIGE